MIKKFFKGILRFIKKWGIYGIIGHLSLYSPLAFGFIFDSPELKTIGWILVALIATPNGFGLLMTIIFAAIYKWLWKVPILGFIIWGRETLLKLQIQNQLMLYYDSEEIQMFLDHGKEIKQERIKMIDQQWSKEKEKMK